jgi:hypothetical protein
LKIDQEWFPFEPEPVIALESLSDQPELPPPREQTTREK